MDKQGHSHRSGPIRAALRRLAALIMGPLFLTGVSVILSELTRTPWAVTAFYVGCGAIVIMVVFTVFGIKAYQYREARMRFDLGTVFLVTIPLAVNLTAVGWLVRSVGAETRRPGDVWFVVPFILIWLLISNVLLLMLAEAIVWIAARIVGVWAALRQMRPQR